MTRNQALLLSAFLVLAALGLAGCKDFSFYSVLGDRIDDTPLQISPATISVADGATLTFTAIGGSPPYDFAVISGTGSGSIVPGSAEGTALFTALTAGTLAVRVTDSKNRQSEAAVTVTPTGAVLTISPGAAPNAVYMGPNGQLTFVASGGTAPYTFELIYSESGAPLGALPGGAYTAGPNLGMDTIQVRDSATPVAAAQATVHITAAVTNVEYELSASSFPATGTGGADFSYDLTIQNTGTANGTQSVSWWLYISDDGSLGSGDSLLASGSIGFLNSLESMPITGQTASWPRSSGSKTLFVMIAADDDLTVFTSAGSGVTIAPPDVDYDITPLSGGAVSYTGAGTQIPGGTVNGSFVFTNTGSIDGSQPVSYLAYASLDPALDPADVLVGSGTTSALDAGDTSAPVDFTGNWPLDYGDYYLIVRLSSSEDPDAGDNTGCTLTTTPVGIFDEIPSEPNGTDFVNLSDAFDLGITLQPGMSVKVTGDMSGPPSVDLDDVFRVHTGTAHSITVSWTLLITNQDLGIFFYSATPPPAPILYGYALAGTPARYSLSMNWIVDASDFRYIDLYNAGSKDLGAYTCIIRAD